MHEESGVSARIVKFIDVSHYSFSVGDETVEKDVHWYLMASDGYDCTPQREEFFMDAGYYRFHEAYHLLKYSNEKIILEKGYDEYRYLKKSGMWLNRKYY